MGSFVCLIASYRISRWRHRVQRIAAMSIFTTFHRWYIPYETTRISDKLDAIHEAMNRAKRDYDESYPTDESVARFLSVQTRLNTRVKYLQERLRTLQSSEEQP